jgi:hypothetical protein
MHLSCYEAKHPNFKLKTRPKQLLGSLPLAFVLPSLVPGEQCNDDKMLINQLYSSYPRVDIHFTGCCTSMLYILPTACIKTYYGHK